MGKNRKRHRPTDPAEAARIAYLNRIDPARWGHNREAFGGDQYRDVSVTEGTREKTARIQRFDCFVTLGMGVDQYKAVRRYQDELATRYGVEGSTRLGEHVDGSGSAELVTQRSLAAANRIEALAGAMPDPWMLPLLEALSLPMVLKGERVNWEAVVRSKRGLVDRDAQARAVKSAAEGVRRAWAEFDAGNLRRAA